MRVTFILLSGLLSMALLHAQNDLIISAHRGYSSIAPENTLSSIQAAIDAGADYTEFDIRRSADDSIMLMHDANLKRTTNGKGAMADKSFGELRTLEAAYRSEFGDQYAGEQIPTLHEALSLSKGKIKVEIEIKEPGLAEEVVEKIQLLGMEDEVIIISFDFDEVAAAKQADPSIPVKWLVGKRWGLTEINRVAGIGGEYIGPSGVPSAELTELAHRNDIGIICYTINSPSGIQRAIDNGIDGIATNFPKRAIAIRDGK